MSCPYTLAVPEEGSNSPVSIDLEGGRERRGGEEGGKSRVHATIEEYYSGTSLIWKQTGQNEVSRCPRFRGLCS